MFPAAESLEQSAKAKIEVLHAIGSDSVSATARENAIAVWMEIYKIRTPEGNCTSKTRREQAHDRSGFLLEVNLAVGGPAMLGSATKEGQTHESFVISIAGIAARFGGLYSNFV